MDTTNRLSRPDRLQLFGNDWGDWGGRYDHMETRLKFKGFLLPPRLKLKPNF